MLTLTIDRSQFRSPEEAFEIVREKIRLLMRRIGCTRWACVLEFQTQTGAGWPHFHILLDVAEGADSIEALRKRVTHYWSKRWGFGAKVAQDLQFTKKSVACYVASYLIKGPDAIPPWVLFRPRSPRMIQFSGAAYDRLAELNLHMRSVRDDDPDDEDTSEASEPASDDRVEADRRRRSLVLDRVASDGMSTLIADRLPDGGLVVHGIAHAPLSEILEAYRHKKIPDWWFRTQVVRYGEKIRVELVPVGEWSREKVEALNVYLERAGVLSKVRRLIDERRAALIGSLAAVQRGENPYPPHLRM